MHLLLIAVGGAIGAVARYAVDGWVSAWSRGGFPWGTLAVNLSGCVLIGLLFAVAIERDLLPADVRGPVMIGFVGAYTTFSTLALESWRLAEDASWLLAAANMGGSGILGIVAVMTGLAIGRAL